MRKVIFIGSAIVFLLFFYWFLDTDNVFALPLCLPDCDSQFISQNFPTTMVAGQTYPVSITMRNTGTIDWTCCSPVSPPGDINFVDGYKLGDPRDGSSPFLPVRVPVPSNISPGQDAVFNFNVTAPSTPNTYNFQWRMVCEQCAWFGEATPNIVINVVPALPPSGNLDGPAHGDTVSGIINIGGWSIDNTTQVEGPIDHVDIIVDSVVVGTITGTGNTPRGDVCGASTQRGCPNVGYTLSWDSRTVGNGQHTIFARATDSTGVSSNSNSAVVNVNNAPPPTPTPTPGTPPTAWVRIDGFEGVAPSVTIGSSVQVTWGSTNANFCQVHRGDAVTTGPIAWEGTSGVVNTPVTQYTRFRIMCQGSVSPDAFAQTSVDVVAPTPTPTPVITPTPTPTPPPDQVPIGAIESVDCLSISGWALDPDTLGTSIDVHLYDGPAGGGGVFIGSFPTNVFRSGINANHGATGNHGYDITTPASFKNGAVHHVHVYGINSNSSGSHPLLSGSPVDLSCSGPVTPTPTPVITPTPTSLPPTPTPTPVVTPTPTPVVTPTPTSAPPTPTPVITPTPTPTPTPSVGALAGQVTIDNFDVVQRNISSAGSSVDFELRVSQQDANLSCPSGNLDWVVWSEAAIGGLPKFEVRRRSAGDTISTRLPLSPNPLDINFNIPNFIPNRLMTNQGFILFRASLACTADTTLNGINNALAVSAPVRVDIGGVNPIPPSRTGTPINFNWDIINPFKDGLRDPRDIILAITNWILNIAAALIVILIIYSGVRLMTAAGRPAEIARAKKILTWALVGFAVVLIGKGFIALIISVLQGNIPSF